MKLHSPVRSDDDSFDWKFAEPMQKFLHTMTSEMLVTIDKCCEFPDVQYSLGKKTENTTSTAAEKKNGKNTSADESGKETPQKKGATTPPAETPPEEIPELAKPTATNLKPPEEVPGEDPAGSHA